MLLSMEDDSEVDVTKMSFEVIEIRCCEVATLCDILEKIHST
jgi:hypothetical protein